ncbi:hypothetical protein [Bradyrhizobium sp. WD16]|uniref:hypothetical protein n=1 Tax=Bradyrhizobium sp. WD16 TaxID=1521768 RepID=UPI0020A4E101|nr:hypothetical protein [Bradyrhizobium sp. WD16]UTD29990.1 hypothetical protein DB459_26870 [Bradyrhizobium sp. WD16]
MSIASLADDEILRTDRQTINVNMRPAIESGLNLEMSSRGLDPDFVNKLIGVIQSPAAQSPIRKTPSSNALDGLVRYIPTESITLYVAATASISSLTATFPFLTPYRLYWIFVALTPILFLLIYVGKRRSQKLPALPQSVAKWPWWKVIASTLAFMVWALAVPPLVAGEAEKVVSAFGALLVSTMLSLVGAVVEPPEA